jgi:uncharacterized protein
MRTALALAAAAALALMSPSAASASSPDTGAPARTIVVSGQGQVQASPDTAAVNFAIETHARTAAEAAERNAAVAKKIVDAVKAKLGGHGTVTTAGYSLDPEYEPHPVGGKPRVIGYAARNAINVETHDLPVVGPLIDVAIAAGANRVNYLNFLLKNDIHARAEAIAAASRDAQEQAKALAASLGVRLGRIISASTVMQPRPLPVAMGTGYGGFVAQRVATPVEPGKLTVSATVFLTFEIE